MFCSLPTIQKLVPLEESVGIQFQHIRLLAKAFSHSSLPYNNLSKYIYHRAHGAPRMHVLEIMFVCTACRGSYQCLEFLGDAVLQFVASLHVYNHLPVHREGCLSVGAASPVHWMVGDWPLYVSARRWCAPIWFKISSWLSSPRSWDSTSTFYFMTIR